MLDNFEGGDDLDDMLDEIDNFSKPNKQPARLERNS
jgi:hypothetical protein